MSIAPEVAQEVVSSVLHQSLPHLQIDHLADALLRGTALPRTAASLRERYMVLPAVRTVQRVQLVAAQTVVVDPSAGALYSHQTR
jgi:hypothetical protein